MKLKKGILFIILLFIATLIVSQFNVVQAAKAGTQKVLNMRFPWKSGYGYDLSVTGESSYKRIHEIFDTSHDNYEAIYCIRGGYGFGSTGLDTSSSQLTPGTYTDYFDLRNRTSITAPYEKAISHMTEEDYKGLLWVLDNSFVREKQNASEEDKEASKLSKILLINATKAYYTKTSLPMDEGGKKVLNNTLDALDPLKEVSDKEMLTDDDIIAVQQAAIWHFTNKNDSQFSSYSVDSLTLHKSATKNSSDTTSMDADIASACGYIFNYLIEGMPTDYDYTKTTATTSPVSLKSTTVTMEESGEYYIVGPYQINAVSGRNIEYSLDGYLLDGTGTTIKDAILLDDKKVEQANTTLKNFIGKDFYVKIPKTTNTDKLTLKLEISFLTTTATYWSVENPGEADQPVAIIEKQKRDITLERPFVPDAPIFDLALRKFITQINGKAPTTSREPEISEQELDKLRKTNNEELGSSSYTTAQKVHPKNPLEVKTGDKVVYTIRIYNEGEADGYAKEITDYLPAGLELAPATSGSINDHYGWKTSESDNKTVKTEYLKDILLEGFNGVTLDYEDIQIECIVTATLEGKQSLKNIAEITLAEDKDGNTVDRDSTPNNVGKENYGTTSQEDDDDFEDLKLVDKPFDLALRKFITTVESEDETKNYDRAPKVDTSKLAAGTSTTATYNHPKNPVGVKMGDIVTYTIRVYNEGEVDGYVTEITDHLPPQLEFIVDDDLNLKYGWIISPNGRTVTTDITSPNTQNSATRDQIYAGRTNTDDKVLLKAFNGGNSLDYIDVQIRCKVKEGINLSDKITNIADITDFVNDAKKPVTDRDSEKDNVVLPTDPKLPEYKDPEIESGKSYIPGQQDDDDFEKLVIQNFDLALRKFITKVNDKDITSRVPAFEIDEDGNYTYVHPKDPITVANGNIVIYTLRIFNEGNIAGYASEIKDDLPEGIIFLPTHQTNVDYRWTMYTADGTKTDDVNEAEYIKTDYLSKEQEQEDGDNLLKAFDPDTMTMPDYRDVKIAFKVTEPNTSDRIITNIAEITDDRDEDNKPVEDTDSEPDNDTPGEDDIDEEHLQVKYFDLSLKKWVSESIVTYKGKTTVTKTGHTGDENPEPVVKVEVRQTKLSQTTVKFKFVIKVTNEGEIEGYAKEITDYVPKGLVFKAADNPLWKEKDGKVVTDQLKDKLLQPGESATVEIVLTWVNGVKNLGEKVNWAEISDDDNPYDAPDIDSTPGNDKKGEDDIDDAPVILSITTGVLPTYVTLTLGVVAIIAAGVILIKKFVM